MYKIIRYRWKNRVFRFNRHLSRLAPFRGQYSYELQVGPVVVQLWHSEGIRLMGGSPRYRSTTGIRRLRFWYDSHWNSSKYAKREFAALVWPVIALAMVAIILLVG